MWFTVVEGHITLIDDAGVVLKGQKVTASSIPVVIASDQSLLEATIQDQDGNDAIEDLRGLMNSVLVELRQMNLHLSCITGQRFRPGDEVR